MKWMVYPFHADINVLTFEKPILFHFNSLQQAI